MQDTDQARSLALLCLTGTIAGALILPAVGHFHVDLASFVGAYVMAALMAIFLPYLRYRAMERLAAGVEVAGLMFLAPVFAVILTYCAMRADMPIADATLQRMDATLGLSSIEAVRTANRHPWIGWLLAQAYSTFGFQILTLAPLLALSGKTTRAYAFVSGFIVLTAVSALTSAAFPSRGAIIAQGYDPADFAYICAESARGFLHTFDAVRGDPDFLLSFRNASGIVTFPSIHAGVAVLCGWAAWPSRLLRLPLVALNGLMFVSAVTSGSHYYIDVIAGGAIAVLTIAFVSDPRWIGKRASSPALVAAADDWVTIPVVPEPAR